MPRWIRLSASRLATALVCSAVLLSTPGVSVASASPPEPAPHVFPLFPSADDREREGFAWVVNHSDRAGTVRIFGIDDTGRQFGPVTLRLNARASAAFNSRDLEAGNFSKGLSGALGDGEGDWRLHLYTELDIEPSSYARGRDGFVTKMHETVRESALGYHVSFFNPGSNSSQRSLLRLMNPTGRAVEVTIRGRDDAGEAPPGGEVRLTMPPGAARTLSSKALETGGDDFEGRFGDGAGKWQLFIAADSEIQVMNLLHSATGHLANLSVPGLRGFIGGEASAQRDYSIPLLIPADNAVRQGFVRLINHSERAGTVRIHGIDDTGEEYGPITIALNARATAALNSGDLENGNSLKGLSGGLGDGEGDWRIRFSTDLEVEVASYIRNLNGFVTSAHAEIRKTAIGYHVPFFNPGSNASQRSRLRLINPTERSIDITVKGRDAAGQPPPEGEVRLTLPPGTARTLTSQELESGGDDIVGRFGDGAGKWQLFVSADDGLCLMNLLESPTGHLANLSGETSRIALVSGRALLGPLADAEIALERLDGVPIAQTLTSSGDRDLQGAGAFSLHVDLASLPDILLVTAHGGRDLDPDNDGVRDRHPVANEGRIHALLPRALLTVPFTLNPLTEIAYHEVQRQYPAGLESTNPAEIQGALDEVSRTYLDSATDYSDLLSFEPAKDHTRSKLDWRLVQQGLVEAIHAGAGSKEIANRVQALSWQGAPEGTQNDNDRVIRRIQGSGDDRVVTELAPDANGGSVRRIEQISVDPTGAMVRTRLTSVTERQARVAITISQAGNTLSISGVSSFLEGLEFSEATAQDLVSRLITLRAAREGQLHIEVDKGIAEALSDGTLNFRINGKTPTADQLDILQDDPLFSWNFLEGEESPSTPDYVPVQNEEGIEVSVQGDLVVVKMTMERYWTLSGLGEETAEAREAYIDDLLFNIGATVSGYLPLSVISTISTLYVHTTKIIPNHVEVRGLSSRVELAGPATPNEELSFHTEYNPIFWYKLSPWRDREDKATKLDVHLHGSVQLWYGVERDALGTCPINLNLTAICAFSVAETLDTLNFGTVVLEPRMGYMIVPVQKIHFTAERTARPYWIPIYEGTLVSARINLELENRLGIWDRNTTYEIETDIGPIYPSFESMVDSERLWLDARSTIVPEHREPEDLGYTWSYEHPDDGLVVLGRGLTLGVPLSTFNGVEAVGITLKVNDGHLTNSVTRTVSLIVGPLWNIEVVPEVRGPAEWRGHYYEYVKRRRTWEEARQEASSRTYQGMQGHLLTITDADEQVFVGLQLLDRKANVSWLGASDAAEDGTWKWVTGPESGTQFWQGATGGSSVGLAYSNWDAGFPSAEGGDCAFVHTNRDVFGAWGNASCDGRASYFVEYSPQPDLSVSANASPSPVEPGDTITVSATVRNQGGARSPETRLRFYRSRDVNVSVQDTPVGSARDVESLPAGGSTSVSANVSAPSSPGTWYYGACADSVAGESQTRNNCSRGRAIVVRDRPVVVNAAPVANAGPDQSVASGATVSLSGARSFDSDGRVVRYAWSQTGGTRVQLSGAGSANASFTAPNVSAETTLVFRLVVTDDDGATDDDTVNVRVRPAGSGTGVYIPDANLRRAIEAKLGKSAGETITRSEMATITSLNLHRAGVRLLVGLEHATNLTSLWFEYNSVSDLSPLASLTSLETLRAAVNPISNLSALSGLTNLTFLSLAENSLSDLSPLSRLTGLRTLQIAENSISNLSALSGLTGLRALGLGKNSIRDISVLSRLTNLTRLSLSYNSISNISALSSLTNLTSLSLSYNSISNVSALSGLTNLTVLGLGNNSISNVSALSGLTNLNTLRLDSNSINDISGLSSLTGLNSLDLESNSISDLSPFVRNQDWGRSTGLNLKDNPLSSTSINVHIPALQARGAAVSW